MELQTEQLGSATARVSCSGHLDMAAAPEFRRYLDAVLDAREALVAVRLDAQLGGAAGTLASMGAAGPEVVREFAAELGLGAPELPWHAHRGRIAALGNETVALADYRARHAQYRSDPDLRRLFQLYPWIMVWDDHETTNDSWKDGAENHQPATEGSWSARKAAALRAGEAVPVAAL